VSAGARAGTHLGAEKMVTTLRWANVSSVMEADGSAAVDLACERKAGSMWDTARTSCAHEKPSARLSADSIIARRRTHDELMCSRDEGEAVVVVERLGDVLPKGVARSSRRDAPPAAVVRVGPHCAVSRASPSYRTHAGRTSGPRAGPPGFGRSSGCGRACRSRATGRRASRRSEGV